MNQFWTTFLLCSFLVFRVYVNIRLKAWEVSTEKRHNVWYNKRSWTSLGPENNKYNLILTWDCLAQRPKTLNFPQLSVNREFHMISHSTVWTVCETRSKSQTWCLHRRTFGITIADRVGHKNQRRKAFPGFVFQTALLIKHFLAKLLLIQLQAVRLSTSFHCLSLCKGNVASLWLVFYSEYIIP